MNNELKELLICGSTNRHLFTIKAKMIVQVESRLSEIQSMEPLDVLKRGIDASTAPFELAGRLARCGWESLSFDNVGKSWKVYTTGYGSHKIVSWQEVESMLNCEE
jgi:hypothetical protein